MLEQLDSYELKNLFFALQAKQFDVSLDYFLSCSLFFLLEKIESGQVEAKPLLQYFKAAGVSLNGPIEAEEIVLSADNLPPLLLAMEHDCFPLVSALLEEGANPNIKIGQHTLFSLWLQRNEGRHHAILRVFLQAHADPMQGSCFICVGEGEEEKVVSIIEYALYIENSDLFYSLIESISRRFSEKNTQSINFVEEEQLVQSKVMHTLLSVFEAKLTSDFCYFQKDTTSDLIRFALFYIKTKLTLFFDNKVNVFFKNRLEALICHNVPGLLEAALAVGHRRLSEKLLIAGPSIEIGKLFYWALRGNNIWFVDFILHFMAEYLPDNTIADLSVSAFFKEELRSTALHCAARFGHTEFLLKLLAEEGLSITLRNTVKDEQLYKTVSVLDVVVETNAVACIQSLQDTGYLNVVEYNTSLPYYNNTPIAVAILSGHSEMCALLLELGFAYRQYDLLFAVEQNNLACVDFLLQKGAPYTIRSLDSSGSSLLHISVGNNNLALLKRLLESGLDPNVVDTRGASPLHVAVIYGKYDFVEVLLAYNASVYLKSHRMQRMPLHIAAMQGCQQIVCLLLSHISKQRCIEKDRFGDTAIDLAIKNNHKECADMIKDKIKVQQYTFRGILDFFVGS